MNGKIAENLSEADLPIWASRDAFPSAPEGYGWIDRKGDLHPCDSLLEISEIIRQDQGSEILLVWTPNSAHCQLPDEIPEFNKPIQEIRKRWVVDDLKNSKNRLKWFGAAAGIYLSYIAIEHWLYLVELTQANGIDLTHLDQVKWMLRNLSKSIEVGIALTVFFIFAFMPWYEAKKNHRHTQSHPLPSSAGIAVLRFETWLSFQKAPVTKLIGILITLVFLIQVIADQSILTFHDSIAAAGLDKIAYKGGESWRLITAPLLHGGILHFGMNFVALLYLGKRMEVLARWPHLPAVFLFSVIIASEASARFTLATSVGASGGLMGWLGFLLVFETLHHRLIPQSARRRLFGGVILTFIIGLIGYRFIDNAAHLGGLIAGAIYAAIVFPKSSSPQRPNIYLTDRILGSACLLIIALAGLLTAIKIFN